MGCFKKWGQVGSIKERGISRKNSINKGKKEKCKKYVGNFVPVVVKIESMQESPDEAYQNVDPWALLETLIQKSEGAVQESQVLRITSKSFHSDALGPPPFTKPT